jgi:hypothetical protein
MGNTDCRGCLVYYICKFQTSFCQWLATGLWFSPGIRFSSTNKTDHQDITEILLKVALSTINLTLTLYLHYYMVFNATFNIITREIISDFSNPEKTTDLTINFQLINRNIVCVWLDLIVRSDFWEEDVCVHIYNMIFLQLSSGWHSIGTKTSKYKESNYEHSCNITIQFSKWFLRKGFFLCTRISQKDLCLTRFHGGSCLIF